MPVTDITKDIENRTLTITAEFAAPVERLWALYSDPRQLEKVFGPPGFPATFVSHDLVAGGASTYYMTGPKGEKYPGRWDITEVNEPRSFAFDDAFTDEDFAPSENMPVSRNVYTFEEAEGGTRATYTTSYESAEALQQVLEMGMEEGATLAINQIDEYLAA